MRQLQGVLLAGVALIALGSSAQADDLTRDFSGVKNGVVEYAPAANQARVQTIIAPGSDGQINGSLNNFGSGGSVEAIVNLNSSLVTFESGTATVGANSVSRSQSGIDILLTNTNDGQIPLTPFGSTIIPAGMGFYVQERIGDPTDGNPFTGYGQSETVNFGDFFSTVGTGVFAQASFDFQVVGGAEDILYSLSGFVTLAFDANGAVIINENLTNASGAGQILDGFENAINNHHALVYDWQSTDIVIPLSGILSGFSERVVTYRANVTSSTRAGCINSGANCIVAFAGFGDPVGRGGGLEELSASFGDIGPLHAEPGQFVIGGLNFAPVTVNVFRSAAVPEPSTWALLIGGFGLAGAALRRRRQVAYT